MHEPSTSKMAPEVPLCRGQCQSLSCSVGTSAVAAQPSADPPRNSGGFGSSCTHRAWLPWLHAAWPCLSLSKGSVIVLHAELGAIKAIAWQLDPDLSQAAEVGLHLLQCSVFTATLPVSSYQALQGMELGCAGVVTFPGGSVWLPSWEDGRTPAGWGYSSEMFHASVACLVGAMPHSLLLSTECKCITYPTCRTGIPTQASIRSHGALRETSGQICGRPQALRQGVSNLPNLTCGQLCTPFRLVTCSTAGVPRCLWNALQVPLLYAACVLP